MNNGSTEKTPISELSTGGSVLVKSPPAEGSCSTLQSKSSKSTIDDISEGNAFLLFGALQLVLGILMAVFGILAIVHDASLSSVGSGLWGGAIAIASGGTGMLAGFRGCYSGGRIPSVFLSAFLATCLISLSVTNLVVVFAITGIVRDGSRPDPILPAVDGLSESEEDGIKLNWSHVLANCGLLLVSLCQCLAVVVSGYRCYQRVCPCSRHHRVLVESPEPSGSFYSTASKEMLVTNWLGGHRPTTPSATSPSLVLLPSNRIGQHIFSFPPPLTGYALHPEACMIGGIQRPQVVMRPHSRFHHIMTHTRRHRNPQEYHRRRRRERKNNRKFKQTEEKPITEEEVAKTYTGLDREIAEEFIEIAMDSSVTKSRSTDDNNVSLFSGK